MRSITYGFEELPVRSVSGDVVARVAGQAELYIDGHDVAHVDISLITEANTTTHLPHLDPIFAPLRREIVERWERFDFDGDRLLHGGRENDEHRLSLRQAV
jgi:hypothetical protein